MSTTEKLARLVSEAEFRALPPEVVEVARVRQCASRILSDDAVETVVQIVERLDAASSRDVGMLVGLLGTGPPPSSA